MGVWETPEGSLALYRSSPELRATRGVMTWFAGHDYSSGWKWINVVEVVDTLATTANVSTV